ncbi:hypothetical protein JMA_39140 (plasmid) [Jeotgalibacillus malaysiensis]|uniref:Polymer-forming cytoskeletal protein n=1 Tax=Jeotgalibacillus malaysiensis TaxID=1508404 RepID=A0A0B5AX14_9BACL|nr:hypothetical protein [Jeotgalibacillus malaysiensis]AJD93232.1 hypothetical protein JMA_39140 [Jeotgalibacillus malaysiensis]
MSKQKKYSMMKVSPNYYQITALIDIPKWGVKAGDRGGFIEKEENLSQDGDGWVGHGCSVEGGSHVKHGLVSNRSTLTGRVTLTNGEVRNSKLDGEIQVNGAILIENSSIYKKGAFTGYGFVKDSFVTNGRFHAGVQLQNTKIESKNDCIFFRSVRCEHVILTVRTANFHKFCEMNTVEIQAKEMRGFEGFEMKHVKANIETIFQIGEEDVFDEEESKSVLVGEEDNPILLKGQRVNLMRAVIQDSPSLMGNISVIESTISGMSKIDLQNGVIKNSTISEMATVKHAGKGMAVIQKMELSGEDHYEIN